MSHPPEAPARHSLFICVTCRRKDSPMDEMRDGMRLFQAVREAHAHATDHEGYVVSPIECMSGCDRACTVGLAGPGKPSYLFGDLAPTPQTAAHALSLATLYRDSKDGVLARGARPVSFRRGILARIPPAER